MSTTIKSGSSSNLANVNTDNELTIAPTKTKTNAGFVITLYENDAGLATGTKDYRSPEVSKDSRLRVGIDTPLDQDTFNYTAQHTGKHTNTVTTMAISYASNFLNLNSGAITTTTTGAILQTKQIFLLPSEGGLIIEEFIQLSAINATNTECFWGRFLPGGATVIPTDGVYFRYTSAGIKGVINNNGNETETGFLSFTPSINTTFKSRLVLHNRYAEFWINDILLGTIEGAAGNPSLTASLSLPKAIQIRTTGTASAGTILRCGGYAVWAIDGNIGLNHRDMKALMGNAYQGQQGGTMGSLANYANSANPTAAVPTNTTAALGTGLGGQFWETDTLAVTTDGIICSFQNPATTVAIQGKNLLVKGVWVDSYVQTALTGGGYNAQWSIAFGHTAVSLATAEAAATKAPRRIPLGSNSVASGATALTQLPRIYIQLNNPIVVYPGEFFAVVKKKVGTAPSAGVIAHTIFVDHVFI